MKIRQVVRSNKLRGLAFNKRFTNFFGNESQFRAEVDSHFDEPMSIRMLDLKAIACAVFYADCRIKRSSSWKRQINVPVKVYDLDFWQNANVLHSLKTVLEFTGDEWGFDFALLPRQPPARELRIAMNLEPMGARVFLATEGADSFPAINIRLAANSEQHFLGVNAISQPVRAARLSSLINSMNKDRLSQMSMVQIPMQQRNDRANRKGKEDTQRSRTFLLLVMASIFACATGNKTIEIYENGIEAFNFPLVPYDNPLTFSQVMNPLLVASMKSFVSLVCEQEITFQMPFLLHTKSMLMREALPLMDGDQLKFTVSCVRFPSHIAGCSQCGVCSGCILRRISFAAAGLSKHDVSDYRIDIFSDEVGSANRFHKLRLLNLQMIFLHDEVLSMQYPEDALASLLKFSGHSQQRQRELITAAAMLTGKSQSEVECSLLDLYIEYGKEWREVVPRIKALGKESVEIDMPTGEAQRKESGFDVA